MKSFLIVFCSMALIGTLTLFAYNSEKGAPRQKDGIIELPLPLHDSLVQRGKVLVNSMNYSERDLAAIAAYLNSK